MEKNCAVCEKAFKVKPSHFYVINTCSKSCSKEYRSAKVENLVSEADMRKAYETDRKSFRQIADEFNINERTVRKLLVRYGIPIRKWSDAVATQWEGWKGSDRRFSDMKNRKYKTKTTDGYYAVNVMGFHPNKQRWDGRVLEHRLVMEWIIGRFLKPSEVVHHINHDKLDNRPENLMLFKSNAEHMRYHRDHPLK